MNLLLFCWKKQIVKKNIFLEMNLSIRFWFLLADGNRATRSAANKLLWAVNLQEFVHLTLEC